MPEQSKQRTALVTGASGGIGEELARRFAKDGHRLVLVARTEAKLRALAEELSGASGLTAHVVAEDLADPAAPARIAEQMRARGIDIDFLVNNAGFGSNGGFLDLDLAREAQMIEVNVASLVKLTHHFAKAMRERGFGRVLNIASTAAFQPGPFMATYYATKAFVLSFSEALAFELQGTGVSVTCYCPGATATNFAAVAGNSKSRLFQKSGVADAKTVASHAYRAMHREKVLAVHGALNLALMESLRVSPRSLVRGIAARLNRASA